MKAGSPSSHSLAENTSDKIYWPGRANNINQRKTLEHLSCSSVISLSFSIMLLVHSSLLLCQNAGGDGHACDTFSPEMPRSRRKPSSIIPHRIGNQCVYQGFLLCQKSWLRLIKCMSQCGFQQIWDLVWGIVQRVSGGRTKVLINGLDTFSM